jgi:hypothetical protein
VMTNRGVQRLVVLLILAGSVVVCVGQADVCYDPFMWAWIITTVFTAIAFGLQISRSRLLRRKSPDR